MTAPRYFRRSWTAMVWGVVIALCLAGALILAGMLTVGSVERRTKAAVTAELRHASDSAIALEIARGDSLVRQLVIARASARQRDTVWLRARAAAQAVTAAPLPSATDTTALLSTLQGCRDTLDATVTACDSAQAAQRLVITALEAQAALHDSARTARAQREVLLQRSRDDARAALHRAHRWRTIERSACAVSLVTNLVQWRLAR
jgi:hypothetical protein